MAAFMYVVGTKAQDPQLDATGHGATEDDVDNITRAINPGLFAHHPGHPISQENMNDIVDRRNNFASIHNWEGLK